MSPIPTPEANEPQPSCVASTSSDDTRWLHSLMAKICAGILLLAVLPVVLPALSNLRPKKNEFRHRDRRIAKLLALAIEQWHQTYQTLPVTPDATGDHICTTDPEGEMIAELSCSDLPHSRNSARMNFLDGIPESQSSSGKVLGGIDYSIPNRPFVIDSFGMPYAVVIDTNNDGRIENPDKANQQKYFTNIKAFVWSAGADRNFETWGDNQTSQ